MGILLLLPFLVSGYWICLNHPRIALSFHKYEGQLLYLLVAREGVISFSIAIVVSVFLSLFSYITFNVPSCSGWVHVSFDYFPIVEKWLTDHELSTQSNSDIGAFLAQAVVLCLIVPKLWTSFAVWRLKRQYNLQTRAELDTQLLSIFVAGNPCLDLLMTSIRHPKTKYLFTMDDRKVYVGNVIGIGKATEAQGVDQHFILIPFLSGYRDKDTMQVEMTTDYASAGESTIMLSQENIVSAMLWKKEVWETFKATQDAKVQVPRAKLKDKLPTRK
ncbi:hypothetical protein AZH11_16240 [Pseudomonas simiae]|nr:hypothetical protein AZH11_16240 [Pseudomonas simiae]